MELNYFIFAGLLLRYLYYWSNNTYTYEYFKTKMLKPVLFSVAVVITLFIVSFYFKFEYTDWWQEPFMALMYVFIGWTPDSVFLALMKLSENKFNKVIEEDKK